MSPTASTQVGSRASVLRRTRRLRRRLVATGPTRTRHLPSARTRKPRSTSCRSPCRASLLRTFQGQPPRSEPAPTWITAYALRIAAVVVAGGERSGHALRQGARPRRRVVHRQASPPCFGAPALAPRRRRGAGRHSGGDPLGHLGSPRAGAASRAGICSGMEAPPLDRIRGPDSAARPASPASGTLSPAVAAFAQRPAPRRSSLRPTMAHHELGLFGHDARRRVPTRSRPRSGPRLRPGWPRSPRGVSRSAPSRASPSVGLSTTSAPARGHAQQPSPLASGRLRIARGRARVARPCSASSSETTRWRLPSWM